MKAFSLALFLIFIFSVAVLSQVDEKVSLIVQYNPKGAASYSEETVARFDFRKGVLIGRKILFSTIPAGYRGVYGIHRERYISLWKSGKTNSNPQREMAFDLKTGKFVRLKPEKILKVSISDLWDTPSPDGKKKIINEYKGDVRDKMVVRIKGRKALVINERFEATSNPNLSIFVPGIPVLWLDNERILTQKKNGKLVVVTLDGKVEPFIEVPCGENDTPGLKKDAEGKIIYLCENDEYLLDIENKTFREIRDDLENGFSEDYVGGESVYYYQNEEIGREGLSESTTAGYLAVTTGRIGNTGFYNQENQDTVKVWNKYTKDWTIIKLDGGFIKILGWMKKR